SAILGAVSDLSIDEIVGYGTGIDEEGLEVKKNVIRKALAVNSPDADDGIDILHKIGGLEIGGMAGVMLGAAAARKPVIIDGLISAAAALIAQKLAPGAVDFMFPSHCSQEPGQARIYELLNLEPFLDLEMRLGEGTGAVLAMNIIEASSRIVAEMATFAEAGIGE
ncbi:MAG: nicotinate-nucleotide--dimethylbenzimidazole phosphoribosyltransferase, partial [Halanaerobiales bacterium]